ncbi:UNVERIFIED_CONTAM: hypothetical protein FKN15_059830 [Acipenser sinensis]
MYDRVRACEACVVISETVKKVFMYVVLSDHCIYLTENPPKTIQAAVHFKDISGIELFWNLTVAPWNGPLGFEPQEWTGKYHPGMEPWTSMSDVEPAQLTATTPALTREGEDEHTLSSEACGISQPFFFTLRTHHAANPATESEDNAALGSLQASSQAPGQTTGVAGARGKAYEEVTGPNDWDVCLAEVIRTFHGSVQEAIDAALRPVIRNVTETATILHALKQEVFDIVSFMKQLTARQDITRADLQQQKDEINQCNARIDAMQDEMADLEEIVTVTSNWWGFLKGLKAIIPFTFFSRKFHIGIQH